VQSAKEAICGSAAVNDCKHGSIGGKTWCESAKTKVEWFAHVRAETAELDILRDMSAPLSTSGVPAESHTWKELEDVFAALGQLARAPVAPPEFYREVLDQSVRALSAVGGAVWLRGAGGVMQPMVHTGWANASFTKSDKGRRTHESLLNDAAANGHVVTVAPASLGKDADAANLSDHVLLVGPVQSRASHVGEFLRNSHDADGTAAIIELLLRADASPATYRGYEQFLTGVCDLAADYHAFAELRRLQTGDDYRRQLLRLGRDVHRHLNLSETAYAVANEGRRVIGCDRLNVLVARGRRCRLVAASGVSRIERQSGAVRRLEKLAELVRRTDEPAFYDDGQSDALPPVAEALEQHAEESHARHVAAIPLHPAAGTSEDESAIASQQPRKRRGSRPQIVLVSEQFDARKDDGPALTERLAEVGDACATALYNALHYDRQPLGWLIRPIGKVARSITAHLPRTLVIAAAIAAGIAALVKVPADFNVEATGTIQPAVRRDVFAPRSGLVDKVLVAHAADVAAGQELIRLRDPSLELELKRVDGEIETAQRQIDAVRTTKTNRAVRDTNLVESYRLSAEERELEQKLTNLRRELELLIHERKQLVVTSPIAGRVLTWDVNYRLEARPVERGEVLLTVADVKDDWQLELDVPDDRLGYVLAAQRELAPDLQVRYRLSSDDREQHIGKIADICQTADVMERDQQAPSPTVLVKVAVDTAELAESAGGELRPGVSARAQIKCGQRPLGYVWLYDIWDKTMEWLEF
jgi:multidrug efflux pump subunit AcrA (membrane-fusion protein)